MNKFINFSASCILALASQTSLAESNKEFIIPGDNNANYDHLVTMPEKTDTSDNKCRDLAREVETLKGKPQRRFTAQQRYEAECLSGQRDY